MNQVQMDEGRTIVQGWLAEARSHPGRFMKTVSVTPAIANALLELSAGNRKITPLDIRRYSTDMREGRWDSGSGETVKVTTDGVLVDAHHRLTCIRFAGVTLEMDIIFNTSPTSRLVIDSGRKRSGADALAIAGNRHISTTAVAVLKRMVAGFTQRTGSWSNPILAEKMARYEPSIAWALEGLNRPFSAVGFVAPLARAHFCEEPMPDLNRFKSVFLLPRDIGDADIPSDLTHAHALRNRLLAHYNFGIGSSGQIALYRTTEAVLNAFLRKEPRSRFGQAPHEFWPIPDDSGYDPDREVLDIITRPGGD